MRNRDGFSGQAQGDSDPGNIPGPVTGGPAARALRQLCPALRLCRLRPVATLRRAAAVSTNRRAAQAAAAAAAAAAATPTRRERVERTRHLAVDPHVAVPTLRVCSEATTSSDGSNTMRGERGEAAPNRTRHWPARRRRREARGGRWCAHSHPAGCRKSAHRRLSAQTKICAQNAAVGKRVREEERGGRRQFPSVGEGRCRPITRPPAPRSFSHI